MSRRTVAVGKVDHITLTAISQISQVSLKIYTCRVSHQINEPLLSRRTIAVGKVDHRLQVVDRLQHRRTHRTRRLAQVALVGRLAAKDVVDHLFD